MLSGKHKPQSCISCHSKLNTSVEKDSFKQQNVNCESCLRISTRVNLFKMAFQIVLIVTGLWIGRHLSLIINQQLSNWMDRIKKLHVTNVLQTNWDKGVYCIQYKLTSLNASTVISDIIVFCCGLLWSQSPHGKAFKMECSTCHTSEKIGK